ncbi:TRAP transporter substrate-binding protein DctP [Poseidonibacter lekithochrous]|uniref:TRAP transporter substrate-binding protein DctP n=1 Tax=Poseidonibacter lekithochrous TaxID=1904463 RepID=UPI0008FC7FBE|nr:TRAP transporter substrate-binding protein DctP [Poseidonibacter lekithochrous]QKJ21647.1 putative osmoregulatory TRAP transporter, substrate binding protein, UehA/TeaA family [Poseidonibacter lekithochrous]
MFRNKLLGTACALLLGAVSLSAETWKFASEEAKKDVQDIYAQEFAKVVKKESNGKIKVRIYYYGQLGGENDIVELTSNGSINFVSVGTGHLGSYVPEVQSISIPYVLTNNEDAAYEVLTTSKTIYNDLAPKFKKANLKLLSMISEGEMAWGANKPIRTPEDFAGQKIRTFTSTIPVETYKAFGAVPTPLSWGEVYSSLQLGTVDGMVNPMYFIYNAKWHMVQKYIMFPGQQPYIGTISTNAKWFAKQTPEKQAIINKAIKAANKAAFEYQKKINKENTAKMLEENKELKLITLTEAERAKFKDISKSLHGTFLDVVAKAYPDDKKEQAKSDAKKILNNLIQEVKDAESRH